MVSFKTVFPFLVLFGVVELLILVISYTNVITNFNQESGFCHLMNVVLLLLSLLSTHLYQKSLLDTNKTKSIQSVMISTLLKLFILAISISVYAFLHKDNLQTSIILVVFCMYVIYTVVEKKNHWQLGKKPI